MRLLFVADGRSPIARRWIRYWIERGDEVYLASTFPCEPLRGLIGQTVVPVAFSGKGGRASRASFPSRSISRLVLPPGLRAAIRHWLGPLTIPRAARRLRAVVRDVRPDLVHALRIPYEGMLAADAYAGVPLVLSVWGNDFTLHAPSTPLMRHYTRWTLRVAAALHADCHRDVRLAKAWGFAADKPTLVVPGSGGVQMEIFHPSEHLIEAPVVVNPRGLRAYVRNDVFFRAIPRVLEAIPQARFLCAAMASEPQAERWVRKNNVSAAVELLPHLSPDQMAALYRRARVLVSPSVHDGTPNSLLEGMASGCLPVAGDLESLREWIEPEENGLLVDPTDPQALADAMLRALRDDALYRRARGRNVALIRQRAEYRRCMAQVEAFYRKLV